MESIELPPGLKLEEIQKWLGQRGDYEAIAKTSGYKANYVSKVLNGAFKNYKIIDAAIDLAIERKTTILQKMERLNSI